LVTPGLASVSSAACTVDRNAAAGMLMPMRVLLGSIIGFALLTAQANAAPIAHCLLKPYAEVRAGPSIGGHVLLSVSNELRVELLEEFGNRWGMGQH
jgi:hypothetical protein